MDPLRQHDPRRIGPYFIVGRLDSEMLSVSVPESRFIARALPSANTVVVSMPFGQSDEDADYTTRFLGEAEQVRRLWPDHAWLEPVVDVAPVGEPPWRVSTYVPGVSLAEAVALHGGPLPEHTVRVLGSFLAAALAQAHGAGFVHAGVLPTTVFLTGDSPRLTGFGTVRVAGPDGRDRSSSSGLIASCTAPEQLSGGRPRPLGDVYGLGATLAFAASGHLSPERAELPAPLRQSIAACLRRDPAHRPQAAALVEEFSPQTPGVSQAPAGELQTVLDRVVHAPSLSRELWIPKRVVAGIAGQAAEVLQAAPELEAEAEALSGETSTPMGVDGSDATGGSVTSAGAAQSRALNGSSSSFSSTTLTSDGTDSRHTTRRILISGGAGLALGIGSAALVGAVRSDSPVPKRSEIRGVPPVPLWEHEISGDSPDDVPLLWRGRVLVVASPDKTIGLDTRTGKKIWTASGVKAYGYPLSVQNDTFIVRDVEAPKFVSAEKGNVIWIAKEHDAPLRQILGVVGDTVWMGVHAGSNRDDGRAVSAYDTSKRKEIWRVGLPESFSLHPFASGHSAVFRMLPLQEAYVIPEVRSKGGTIEEVKAKRFVAVSRTGAKLWTRTFDDVPLDAEVYSLTHNLALCVNKKKLHAFNLSDGTAAWSLEVESGAQSWGAPDVDAGFVYISDSQHVTYAIDTVSGDIRWKTDPEPLVAERVLEMVHTHISASGKTVLVVHATGILAIRASDGSLLWRLSDANTYQGSDINPGRLVAIGDDAMYLVSGNTVAALPVV